MRISKIGEFGLIEQIKRQIKSDSSVIQGIGDDCAVIKYTDSQYLLLTCDMLIEGVDFLKNTKPFLIGKKAIACSISDIAAKCGEPKYALISLGLPRNKQVQYVKELYRGMSYWADKFKINIVGGDISRADKLTIDVSMAGLVNKNKLILRSGAKKGDLIFVTGLLGGSIRGRHLKFSPRLKEARYLAANFKINSMIDISDGLGQDLGHIAKASNLGAVIYEGLIPLSPQARNLDEALTMGEDFELLFTLPLKEARRLNAAGNKIFTQIGEITDKKRGLKIITRGCKEKKLNPKGYAHF